MEEQIASIFNADSCIEVLTPFSLDSFFYVGKIRIDYKGVQLDFKVSIAKCYPFTLPNTDNISVIFENVDLIGLPHINIDGTVCFHPDKDDDFERKLKSEIDGLKTWIYEYFICRKEDDNYTYLIHHTESNKSAALYFSDNDKIFKKDDFGTFQYSMYSNYEFEVGSKTEKSKVQTFFRIGFGKDFDDKWSADFLTKLKLNLLNGFWVYIEHEPIIDDSEKRKGIESWNQLEAYLPDSFVKHLYDSFRGLNKSFFFESDLFVLIGYKIPNDEGYEIHWDLIKVDKHKLPIMTVSIPREERAFGQGKYISVCTNDKIRWGSTFNCNYSRFFGRGRLSEKLINSRVLIIGCGALGSALAESLVRGGCRNIALDDFDYVASGNLCRSKFNLTNLNRSKIESLKTILTGISPYVEIFNIPLKLNHYSDMEDWLDKSIDIVFDCSTDTEVTYTFDKINFKGWVFSLSITNKAKDLVCLTGQNITRKANHFYEYLGNEQPSFYEGAGCGYPTFEANFNEINSLLDLAVMNINLQVNQNSSDDFIISREIENGFNKLKIEGFYNFFQTETQNHIYISNETLAKIKGALYSHFPNEFGGVFVGFKRQDFLIIKDVLIPDDFENGKTVFIRHPGSLNERLKVLFDETDGKITYVGEWHSHPNGPAIPSSTDKIAMKEIAENPEIDNSNPVLMIVKITEQVFEPTFFLYQNENLLNYE